MKKIIVFTLALFFVASSAFAASSVSITTSFPDAGKELRADPNTATATTNLIGKTSTGVGLGMIVDATDGEGYAMVTQHKSGSKAFGTAFDSSAIYSTVSDGVPGVIVLAVPGATDTADFVGTAWKPL